VRRYCLIHTGEHAAYENVREAIREVLDPTRLAPPVVIENLSEAMIGLYRAVGIFAHENPVRETVDRLEALAPKWVHAMHGGTIAGDALAPYTNALREREFGWNGMLLGRELRAPTTVG
jgi:hypothetical protein